MQKGVGGIFITQWPTHVSEAPPHVSGQTYTENITGHKLTDTISSYAWYCVYKNHKQVWFTFLAEANTHQKQVQFTAENPVTHSLCVLEFYCILDHMGESMTKTTYAYGYAVVYIAKR